MCKNNQTQLTNALYWNSPTSCHQSSWDHYYPNPYRKKTIIKKPLQSILFVSSQLTIESHSAVCSWWLLVCQDQCFVPTPYITKKNISRCPYFVKIITYNLQSFDIGICQRCTIKSCNTVVVQKSKKNTQTISKNTWQGIFSLSSQLTVWLHSAACLWYLLVQGRCCATNIYTKKKMIKLCEHGDEYQTQLTNALYWNSPTSCHRRLWDGCYLNAYRKKQSLKNHYNAFCLFLPNLQLSHTQRHVRNGCWFAKTVVVGQNSMYRNKILDFQSLWIKNLTYNLQFRNTWRSCQVRAIKTCEIIVTKN